MSLSKKKGGHSPAAHSARREETGTVLPRVEVERPRLQKKHLMFMIFMSIAAVMVILLALVLLKSVDSKKYGEYMDLASACYEQGSYENSLRYLRKAQEIESSEECLLMMADCYERLKNYDKALETLRRLDTRRPDIAGRIADIEEKKAILAEQEKVTIAGHDYPSDTTGLALDDMNIGDGELQELLQLYGLTNLSLCNNNISDVTALASLGGLTTLNLSGNSITDISPLSRITGLRTLYLDGNPISDFTPLYSMTNLTTLSIMDIEISEEQLKELSNALPNCAIHSETALDDVVDISIGGVTFKSDVEELDLSGLGISDISALSGCTQLKVLNLSGNEISDLYALMNLPELECLDISYNQISDLRPLMGLTTLRKINANGNSITSTVPLGAMTGLTHLYLEDNPITDFSGFKKLRGLQVLSVKNTGLNDEGVGCLSYLSSLSELNIEDNPLISGEAVDEMLARIGSCQLIHSKLVYSVDIEGHSVRTDAVELDLSACGIVDIANLGRLDRLETLRLGKNSISNIYIFQYTDSRMTIKTLDLSNNEIEDITALSYLVNMEYLDISNNKVNSILPLMSLTNLRQLYISGNNLSEQQISTLETTLINCEIHWQ